MMTMILGLTGSGKSLFAVGLVIRELRASVRPIVTTLALDVGRVNEYVQELFPNEDLRAVQRIYRLEDKQQLAVFWRYRGGSRLGAFGTSEFVHAGGVCYFLDEVQVAFNAREWQKTSAEVTEYITQHRKLGDDIICCTPHSSLVDKQFRSLAAETIYLQNWYLRKVSCFTMPRRIVWKKYLNCPPQTGEPALEKGHLYVDAKNVASCYRTEEGVGVLGSNADKGRRAKGVPWWGVFVGIGLAGIVFWICLKGVMGMAANRTLTHLGDTGRRMTTEAHAASSRPTEKEKIVKSEKKEEIVKRYTGFSRSKGRGEVWFEDGTKADTRRGDTIEWKGDQVFRINGVFVEPKH